MQGILLSVLTIQMNDYQIQWDKFRFSLPSIIIKEKGKRAHPHAPENAIAVYEHSFKRITISFGNDNWGIKLHEYGHWFFASFFDFIDEFWELIWWYFGVRKIFVKPQE